MGLDTMIYLSAMPKCPSYDAKHCYMTPDLMLVQNAKSYLLLVSATVLSWLASKCSPNVNALHPFTHSSCNYCMLTVFQGVAAHVM